MAKHQGTRVAILGVAIDNLSMNEVLNAIEVKIAEGGFHQVATANVDFLMKSIRDEELHETLCRCDFVLADGMPLVWASQLLGSGLKERVTGADLVPRLAQLSACRGYRIFLLGSSEESCAGAADWMERNHPGACIAGRYSPKYQALEEMDHEDILQRIEAARPDVLLVAFGNPKQEKWIAMHRHRLNVPVCIGVGASFDFLSGQASRAPMWMQQSGMEWFYRMLQEPSRLSKRYASNAVGLMRHLPAQLLLMAVQRKRRVAGFISQEKIGSVAVLRIDGNLAGSALAQFDAEAQSAILSRSHVVLDMSKTSYLGADGLGSLVQLLRDTHRWKLELWLAGLHPVLVRIIRAAKLGPYFRVVPKVAEALRRIEPELVPRVPQFEANWEFCRIGGQLIPIHNQDVPYVCHQVEQLFTQRMTIESSDLRPAGHENPRVVRKLTPVDAH
jgi:N-acetylglucosaminyldiphosphoundecaprenol N-acetyl-beta-D-mannosaminyltransferase